MNKTLILGAALALLTAAPALAQSYNPNLGTGNVVPAPTAWHNDTTARGDAAYAYVPAQAMPMTAHDQVYVSGHYVGADPDPNIRLQLRHDPSELTY